ncbi:MAG: tetratricopeptide repeat-containing sensor histidine kinase [Salinivirgaceae bacterium]|nr:tetratricopeptide repeat-containing sensor histidine kinase [Salinivirgaceae bacterium]
MTRFQSLMFFLLVFNILRANVNVDSICSGSQLEKMLPGDKLTCIYNYCKLNLDKNPYEIQKVLNQTFEFIKLNKLENRLGEYYYYYGNMFLEIEAYDSAEVYFLKSLEVIPERNLELLYSLNLKLGISYRRQNDFSPSLKLFEEALVYANQTNNKKYIGNIYQELGNLYSEKELYSEAISNFQRAINNFKDKNDTLSVAQVYTNIATLYRRTGNNPLAMDYLQKSHSIYKKLNNYEGLAAAYINMGQVYENMTNYVKAEEQLLKARDIYERINYQLYLGMVYNNLGNVERNLKKIDESKFSLNKALDIFIRLNNKVGQINALKDLGQLYATIEDQKEAQKYFHKSLRLSASLSSPLLKLELFEMLAVSYSKSLEYEKAYKYRVMYEKQFHENLIADKNREYFLLRSKLQYKEEQVDEMTQEFTMQISKIENRIIFYRRSLGLLIISFLLALGYMYFRFVNSLKYRTIEMNHKTKKIDQLLLRIDDYTNKIEILNKTKEKFFAITTKNIVEPVESLRRLVNKISDVNDENMDKRLLTFIYTNKDSITMAFNLIENILFWSRNQEGKIEYEPNYGNLEDVIKKVVAFQTIRAEAKNIKLQLHDLIDFDGYFDKKMMEVAFRNLIENAIKFSTWGSMVEIKGKREEGKLLVSIIDKGVGMSKEQVSKLETAEKISAAIGTHGEKGGGIGYILASEFIKRNFGIIQVESSIAEGTKITITLPSSSKKLT